MLNRIRNEERGVAMVVSLMVAFVVLLLSTVVVSQAIHSSDQSGYDRERLQSVNTAEAGLDYYYNYLASTPVTSMTTNPVTVTTGVAPGTSSVTISPTFYSDAGGVTTFSGSFSASSYPRSVKIVSVGSANGSTLRTMESFVVLHPIFAGFEGAIVANSSTTFTNNFTVNGNNGNDGNIYVLTGNFTIPSGLDSIKGSVYVTNGTANLSSNNHVYGTVWANGSVTLNHAQEQVDGDVKSTTTSVTVSSGHVNPGGASYCTTISGTANITGAKVQTCSLGSPPTQPFPTIKYNQTDWSSDTPAYTNFQTFSNAATACTDARNYIEGTGAGTYNGGSVGNTVVRITQSCTYSNSNNATISLGSNLAIVTDGAINLSQQSNWNGVTSTRDVFFMSAYPSSGTPTCTGGVKDVTLGNNTGFNNLTEAFVYTPCTASMQNNNTAFTGQVIGATVAIGNNFNMTYRPVKVPGQNPTGYNQDIAYIREIR